METLRAIKNHVIFRFEDEVVFKKDNDKARTQFSTTTDWGFETSSYDDGAKLPRWGVATSCGPKVTEVSVGDRILIEPLQWTPGADIENTTHWRTDVTQIMAVEK